MTHRSTGPTAALLAAPAVQGASVVRPLRVPLLVAAVLSLGAALAALSLPSTDRSIATFFLAGDCVALTATSLALAVAALAPASAAWGHWSGLEMRPGRAALALAAGVTILTLAGTVLLHGGFPLSYDEVMADFDARLFRSGRLIAPVPPEWRPYVAALVPKFVLPVPGDAAWVSSYLPGNAMLRAGFGLLGEPALTGPVLVGFAVLLLFGVARRLWPDRPDAALVAGLLLATAPQVLVTATTAYAMTAHLALNLLWLRLFLRGGRAGHGAAAVVGFAACGLHQIVFHPLFALPFLAGLVLRRRWAPALFYLVAYGLAGLFWTFYWQELLMVSGIGQDGAAAVGSGYMMDRVAALLRAFDWGGLALMSKNLVRFAAWQNPLLLPLAALAWPAVRRGEGLARPLAAGIALTLLAMAVLLPFQGHGWGYRYLHGLLGSACLLAAQGWVAATRSLDGPARAAARRAVGIGCAFALLVLLPFQAAQAYRLAAPFAASVAAIAHMDADIVLVDDRGLSYGADLVRNAPDLSNRPKVLLLERLDAARVRALCGRGTVALFGSAEAAKAGFDPAPSSDDPAADAARAVLTEPVCHHGAG